LLVRIARLIVVAVLLLLLLPVNAAKEGRLAVPDAAGFGARALEGWPTAPTVGLVTSLADSGAGTFRECIATSNRICVFRVSGNIELESQLNVSTDHLLVNFLTAPGEGVQLVRSDAWSPNSEKHMVVISGDHHAWIGLRARGAIPATGFPGDIVQIDPTASHVFFDRCSLSWGSDEVIDIEKGASHVTFQRCLITEPLALTDANAAPGYLILNSGAYISFWRNVMALAHSRFPSSSGGGTAEVRENLMYPTTGAVASENSDCDNAGRALHLGFWNNRWLIPSSLSPTVAPIRTLPQQSCVTAGFGCDGVDAYLSGESVSWSHETEILCREQGLDGSGCTSATNEADGACASHTELLVTTPPLVHYTRPESAASALEAHLVVRKEAGHPYEDSVDACVRAHIVARTGETLEGVVTGASLAQVTDGCGPYDTLAEDGVPYTDADSDGMDDDCETEYLGGTGASATDDLDGDGYLNIEECFNGTRPDVWRRFRYVSDPGW
jgi:hypothetical protein